METETIQHLRNIIKHGYMRLFIGVILIITGLWVFLHPMMPRKDYSVPFALTFLTVGFVEVIYAACNMDTFAKWGWLLAGGIIDVLIGTRLILQPHIFMIVLPVFIGFVVFLRSIMAIIWFMELHKRNKIHGGIMLAAGIIGLTSAFILFFNHALAGLTFVWGTSVAFVFIGIFEIYLSSCLKRLKIVEANHKSSDHVQSE